MTDPFSRPPDQLGFVVSDLEAAVMGWLDRGVGPWLTLGGAKLFEFEGGRAFPTVNLPLGALVRREE